MTNRKTIELSEQVAADERLTTRVAMDGYGVTEGGFVPKPFARLLAERVEVASRLFGGDIDLSSGAVLRKIMELSALEDARLWAALANVYDSGFVATASGEPLSLLGDELGLRRPNEHADGKILFAASEAVVIPLGTRLVTPGGHHVATSATVALTSERPTTEAAVRAFYPGPSHNLDPTVPDADGVFSQRIDAFHPLDPKRPPNHEAVTIEHTQPLSGGEVLWDDARYRALLREAPRSVWTARAVEMAARLVPGVRAVRLRDPFGGLDVDQAIFGTFNFLERLFGQQRDSFGVYQAKLLVAPTPDAILLGDEGLLAAVRAAIEEVRPLGIHPELRAATRIAVGVQARVALRDTPLPLVSSELLAETAAGASIRARLRTRLRVSINELSFGEPVSAARLTWALMNDPDVADVRDLQLLRFPSLDRAFDAVDAVSEIACGENLVLGPDEIAELAEVHDDLRLERAL